MSEVLISNKPRKIVSLNSFKNCSSHWFMIGQETMYQLAQRFDVSEPGLQLTGITLCKDRSASVFRIRVYDYDSITKAPSSDITDSLIEIRSADSKVRIDLNNYNIIIPGKSFFVAVEWIFIPGNEDVDKVKLNGKKTDFIWIRPAVRFRKNRIKEDSKIWMLHWRGKWEARNSDQEHNFQISVDLEQ